MPRNVVPMIHVPDVRSTVAWYETLGFTVEGTNEDDGEMNWARLTFGRGELMFAAGGHPSTAERREMDVYIEVDEVEALYQRLKERAELVAEINDTFYGMREFIIRDLNRFWITFGQPVATG
ncbi:MAG: VOC family protein [Gemmatimonadota bacterium]